MTPAENLPKKERLERSPAGAFWGEEACIDVPRRPTRAGAAGRKQVHWVAIMANKVILTSILRSWEKWFFSGRLSGSAAEPLGVAL